MPPQPPVKFNFGASSASQAGQAGQYAGQFGDAYDKQSQNRLYGTQYFDQVYSQYMSFIEQYKTSNPELYERLKGLLQFNAYNPSNKESFWGDTSGIQDFYNNHFNTAMQNAQQLIDEYNQREYNDPASQMSRMQNAGLNPALSGGENITPGEAGDATPDPVPVESPAHEGSAPLLDFANMGMNFFNGVLSLMSGVQSLGISFTQKGLLNGQLADAAWNFAVKEEAGKVRFPTKSDGSVDYSAVPEHLIESITKESRPKGAWGKALQHARGNIVYDSEGRPSTALTRAFRENMEAATSAQRHAAENMAQPGYDDDLDAYAAGFADIIVSKQTQALDFDVKIRAFDKKIREVEAGNAESLGRSQVARAAAEARGASAQARSQGAIADYNEGLLSPELGSAEGRSRQLSAELDSIESEIDKELESTWKEIQDYIGKKEHGRLGHYGRILMPGLRQEVESIFEHRRQAVRERRSRLNALGDAATNALVNSVKP